LKSIILLGSTGSIGTQTLDVVRNNPDKFRVELLSANRSADKLIEQAKQFKPKHIVIGNAGFYEYVKAALFDCDIEVHAGNETLNDLIKTVEADLVVSAMVGFAGLIPTLKALEAGKNVAIANKETLVVAGEIVTETAKKNNCSLIPIDSEHSAIQQCMAGEDWSAVEKLILTASGGPFRNYTQKQLEKATPKQALKHPNWKMGSKITIDSATMMNKGFEVIEACWLFGIDLEKIDVVVHPQSIIHSMVQFIDGSIKAQMGLPDMRLPIQYALDFPNRLPNSFPRFTFDTVENLTFEKPDMEKFRCLFIAWHSQKAGGNVPCLLNAANEIAVNAYLKEQIKFTQIPEAVEETIIRCFKSKKPTLDILIESDLEARLRAEEYIIRYLT